MIKDFQLIVINSHIFPIIPIKNFHFLIYPKTTHKTQAGSYTFTLLLLKLFDLHPHWWNCFWTALNSEQKTMTCESDIFRKYRYECISIFTGFSWQIFPMHTYVYFCRLHFLGCTHFCTGKPQSPCWDQEKSHPPAWGTPGPWCS